MNKPVAVMSPFVKDKAWAHPGESASRQYAWETVASLTAATSALAGNAINTTVIAALGTTKVDIYLVENGTVAFEVRSRMGGANTTDGDVDAIEMYAGAKDLLADMFFYRRVATLTWTRGTGEFWPTVVDPNPATIWFCDELAVTNANNWLSDRVDAGEDGSNDYASYVINNHGYARFAFLMSTKDTNVTTHYVDIRRF